MLWPRRRRNEENRQCAGQQRYRKTAILAISLEMRFAERNSDSDRLLRKQKGKRVRKDAEEKEEVKNGVVPSEAFLD